MLFPVRDSRFGMQGIVDSRVRVLAVALAIALYGGLLRLDALVSKYGPLDRPAWAALLTHHVAPIGRSLRPFEAGWAPEAKPYEGGDPINYLRFAREMTGFYQAHVREPVFLALTRGLLWLLDGQDVAVSFASLIGSVLAVLGTYFLAAALMPPVAALAASLLMAVEYEMISWAPDGWRDDTFTAAVVWTAWACLRLRSSPTVGNAALFGACAGAACLTRITALSFVIPALLWLVGDGGEAPRRARFRGAAIALGIMAALVAPYLISCAMATGDPLLAINYHTAYYRHHEGLPAGPALSAAGYIGDKFSQRPAAALDTGFYGLVVQPFVTKWQGLEPIVGAGRVWLAWCAAAGLLLFGFTAAGRLTLVVLFASLVPYAFTWNIGGGNAWRFTMHAYPFYMTAAIYAIERGWRLVALAARTPREQWRRPSRPQVARAAGVGAVALAVSAIYFGMPWLVIREAITRGEDATIATGGRDVLFYRAGWLKPRLDGVVVRVSRAERAVVQVPLPLVRAYDLVLRADPVLPAVQQRLSVLFNGHFVARFPLAFAPDRVGSYRLQLQPHQVRVGWNDLVLIPDTLVAAAAAGPRFAWIDPDERIGIRLWYVRVLPVER